MNDSHSNSITVLANNITVAYRSYKERPTSLKENLLRFLSTGNMLYYTTFNALENVSFSVPRGEVLGVMGSNGSGKSTLLKVLAKVLKPKTGSVAINGNISSLIELGAGFDPELTARENIFLSGSLHKLTKSVIEKRVDRIIDFAELREFSETPVKYFSSGMYARLGFSVAIDLNPDIFLIDEILAVGDERFQVKCGEVFNNFTKEGKTLVIVSHDLQMLERRASVVALLAKGKLVYYGSPSEALRIYRDGSYQAALCA